MENEHNNHHILQEHLSGIRIMISFTSINIIMKVRYNLFVTENVECCGLIIATDKI